MKCLQKQLEELMDSDYYPFHMPGHKRNTELMKMGNPYGIDITEIDEFDNLHLADGILNDVMKEAAVAYGADKSYLLVNGSTSGILIAMAAVTKHGDKVIMARNCHRAAYHALYLNELDPVYLYPQDIKKWGISGPILPEDVDNALRKNPDAKMVLITSPTYEGVVSDIEGISKVVHRYQIPLIVDEAHGAHFGFDSYFPQNSIRLGADIVINSVHKTLPAFTQTALLCTKGPYVNQRRISQFSAMYQSSSPSYIFMSGIQNSIRIMMDRKDLIEQWKANLTDFYNEMLSLQHLRIFKDDNFILDPSKLIISTKNTSMTGAQLYDILRENYHLQMEAEYSDYVIAMTSIADTKGGFKRLKQALRQIDEKLTSQAIQTPSYPVLPRSTRVLKPYDADKMKLEEYSLMSSQGAISGEYVFLYPPGIPLLVPGEIITDELVKTIEWYKEQGLTIKGLEDKLAQSIRVIATGGKDNG